MPIDDENRESGDDARPRRAATSGPAAQAPGRNSIGRWRGVGALAVTGLTGLGLMYAVPEYGLLWLLLMVAVSVWVAARSRVRD
jgi:hypothetical protein